MHFCFYALCLYVFVHLCIYVFIYAYIYVPNKKINTAFEESDHDNLGINLNNHSYIGGVGAVVTSNPASEVTGSISGLVEG